MALLHHNDIAAAVGGDAAGPSAAVDAAPTIVDIAGGELAAAGA